MTQLALSISLGVAVLLAIVVYGLSSLGPTESAPPVATVTISESQAVPAETMPMTMPDSQTSSAGTIDSAPAISPEPETSAGIQAAPVPKTPAKMPTKPVDVQPAPVAQARATTHNVAITDYVFAPALLSIKAGDTVVWTNNDLARHTIESSAFESPLIEQGKTYSHTFQTAGTFDYFCGPHPYMKATIRVTER